MNTPTLITLTARPRTLRTLVLVTLASAVVGLAACNTTEGVGKDVKSLGRGVEDAARDAK